MAVFTTPRRITLYWLLLLVPTLAVGSGAIYLLRREHARLAESSAEADKARRAALAARASLVVENIELLIGDVQAGLLDTLAGEPADELDAFLEEWEKDNPLVRTAFRATADGRVLRPAARSTAEDARGFLRRYARQFGPKPPWGGAAREESPALAPAVLKRQQDENEARKNIDSNVTQNWSARRDVQELVKTPDYSNSPQANRARQSPPVALAEGASQSSALAGLAKTESDRALSDAREHQAPAAAAPRLAQSGAAGRPFFESEAKTALTSKLRSKDAPADRRGWEPWSVDGRLHLLGWLQPGGAGEVRGVELEVVALIGRLGGALPAEVGAGEGYALRDDQGRVMHQVGTVPRAGDPAVRVPLAAKLLPGWDVVAYLTLPPATSGGDAGFFWASASLGAIFIAAILAGGWLLLWQARRSEAEAAQKTSFVANVSHEFKTPLTTIRLYAELLEQGRVRDAAQGGDYLRTIGRETQRLARLVNNALDFSRLEQGKKKYAREAVDLGAALTRLLDTHAPRVAEAGMVLERALPAEPLSVMTDRDALEQIVLNLIDNACKYAAEGGEVVVTAARQAEGNGAEVRVKDRGPGVPAEHRERIFEKFHRVDDALTAEKTGAGLGLSIARQLARGLGGELRYAPREGGGAEFILELP
ncbi:MAG: HAMP domain-containing sensor histidine kinase [Opitutaceae bacterium]